jgi:AcrR family transcriptional regulator
MARPVSIPDEVILDAARQLFLERGSDVPTNEIAARAGVSHGIIFKRFKTKRVLFNAAMNVATDWDRALPTLLNANIGKRPVETALIEVGSLFVEKFLVLIPTLMMRWSTRPENRAQEHAEVRDAKRNRAAHSLRVVKAITSYLEAEHKLGRIGKADFDVVAQAFVGALWYHSFLQVTLGGKRPANHRLYVTRLVRLLLSGTGQGRAS